MLVQDIMTRDVITLDPEDTVGDALKVFMGLRIRRAPVVERGRVVGFVSDRKISATLGGTVGLVSTEVAKAALDSTVREIMNHKVVRVAPTTHLDDAIATMMARKIGGVPVIDSRERLVGILTGSDLFRALWHILGAGRGARILLSEAPHDIRGSSDIARLAERHGCIIHSLVRYPRPDGGFQTVLRVSEGDLPALLDDAWKCGDQVIDISRPVDKTPPAVRR